MGKPKYLYMQEAYGKMDKITCRGCCNLIAAERLPDGKAKYCCAAFDEAARWNPFSPACGLYGTPAKSESTAAAKPRRGKKI